MKKKKMSLQYDIDSYSQNFDDNYNLTNPDDAYRSFSVRFAIVNSKFSFDKRCEDISSENDDTCSETSFWSFLLFR